MGDLTKWVFGIFIFVLFFYGIIIAINEIKIRKKKSKEFPCTYISGRCTVKPTYKNCEKVGAVPYDYCEAAINGRFLKTNEN